MRRKLKDEEICIFRNDGKVYAINSSGERILVPEHMSGKSNAEIKDFYMKSFNTIRKGVI